MTGTEKIRVVVPFAGGIAEGVYSALCAARDAQPTRHWEGPPLAHRPTISFVDLTDAGDFGYLSLLEELWEQPEDGDLVICEHDNFFTENVLYGFQNCDRPLCGHEYPLTAMFNGPALGCTRFRASLMRSHPDFLTAAREAAPPLHYPAGHFIHLGDLLLGYARSLPGVGVCTHSPRIGHRDPFVPREQRPLPVDPYELDLEPGDEVTAPSPYTTAPYEIDRIAPL